MKVMWEKIKAGNIAEAVALQSRVNNIYELFDRPDIGVIQGIKAILRRQEIPAGVPKLPKAPLTDKKLLAELFKAYDENILR
jgi:dihydrodipicolinate synthase/N-acetylneuraminate lyase